MTKRKIGVLIFALLLCFSVAMLFAACSGTQGEKGDKGDAGADGVGIVSVVKTDSEGLLDIYEITYSDGTSTTFTVTNGKDGTDGADGEDGTDGQDGSDGKDGQDGLTPFIGENGNWWIGQTDTGIKAHGNDGQDGSDGKDGQDGLSVFEIYIKYHPEYTGSEEEWIKALISGTLDEDASYEIEYIPDLYLTAAVGETVTLPDEIVVYFADGGVGKYEVTWTKVPSTSFIGLKTVKGTITELGVEVQCLLQVTNYSTGEKYINGFVNGILGTDSVTVTLYNQSYMQTLPVSDDGYFSFTGLQDGTYYIKVDASGYEVTQPQTVVISSVTADEDTLYSNIAHIYFDLVAHRSAGYYFTWNRTDVIGNTETSAAVIDKINVDFLENTDYVSDTGDASYLREEYNVVLQDDELIWSSEASSRFLELYEKIPQSVTSDLKSVWTLTKNEQQNDISFKETNGVWYVTVSKSAIESMTPRVAVSDGVTGKYFSNRFYNALVRFVTNNGTDAAKCETILNENFATSFNVPDYSVLTAGITNEDASQFQEFYPEEKLLILTMFEEMPEGMHKMPELKYLVRRKTGQSHPLYPSAAAVTWTTASQPYIEFMDVAFGASDGYYETKRLIIHEKMHIFWEYYFSDALKEQWYEVGGWYENPEDADGWSTTKQTEFVSAYAHAHNPDEDMAESVATYVIDPDLLRSRSLAKYEFIKEYIMGGSFYLVQIRNDLTFEVYNLNPDYTYPGQIDSISLQVDGGPYEDKLVTFEIRLHGSEEFEGAESILFRLQPADKNCNQYYDVWLSKADDYGLVFHGTEVISKYSYDGYWYTDQIEIFDSVGNERYESNTDYSMKVYIDNPLYDNIPPELVRGSLELWLENANNPEHPGTQYLVVKFKFYENISFDRALVRLYCKNALKGRITKMDSLKNTKSSLDLTKNDL